MRRFTALLLVAFMAGLLPASLGSAGSAVAAEPQVVAGSPDPVAVQPDPSSAPSESASSEPVQPVDESPSSPPLVVGPAPTTVDADITGPEPAAAPVATTTEFILPNDYGAVDNAKPFSIQVNPAPPGGTVQLKIDGVVVDSGTLPGGTPDISLSWTPSAPGTYNAQAVYGGTTGYVASSSAVQVVYVVQLPPDIQVTPSTYQPALDEVVDFTANVTPDPGGGAIEWLVDNAVQTSMSLEAGGVAHWSTSFALPYVHSVTAHFTGFGIYPESTGNANVSLVPLASTVTVTLPPDPIPAGLVTATVTVSPNPGGGTLTWHRLYTGPTELAIDPDGVTEIPLGDLATGTETLSVSFSGYGRYSGSSGSATFTVLSVGGVSLTTNRISATQGELPVVLTASVVPYAIGGPGTVTFLDDVAGSVVELGPVSFDVYAWTAVYSSNALRVGTHTIRARFDGIPGYQIPATSSPVTVTVLADTVVHASFKPSLATFYPYKEGYRDTVSLTGILDETATVTIRAYNGSGTLKRTWSLGTRAPGVYRATWNGRTAAGTALPAGKYKVKASFKDVKGHTLSITSYVTISWRQATWKTGTTITRYGDQLAYYSTPGDHLFYSDDYARGRVLYSAYFNRDCAPNCQIVYGVTTFSLNTSALDYRYVKVSVTGHTFIDYNSGDMMFVRWSTNTPENVGYLPDYTSQPINYNVAKVYVSSDRKVRFLAWCSEASGAAFDLHYLKLAYQYAVWK
jgi:hypothetical protein